MRVFKVNQTVRLHDTGEAVLIVDVLPLGDQVFYRIEHESGERALVASYKVREAR